MVDLEAKQKDTENYVIVIKDNGVVVDITGYVFVMSIKEKITDTDANAKVRKRVTSHSDPTNGETTITLTGSDTNQTVNSSTQTYVYDIVMVNTSSEEKSLMDGVFRFKRRSTIDTAAL